MSGIVAPRMMRLPSRRRDQIWLAVIVSLIVHVLLFLAISLFQRPPPPVVPPPMEITIAEDVGLTAGSPNTTEDPAESKAPEIAPPVDSAPPAPTPEKPEPEPAPPVPQPSAAPPPKPAAVSKPQPAKVAPPARTPAKTPAKPALTAPAKPAPVPGKGKSGTSLPRPSGGLSFDRNYFGGATNKPSTGTATVAKAATMTPQARANIASKIAEQIQPCAQRQSLTAPGVGKIRVVVALSFAETGNPSAAPRVVRLEGLDDDNQRYAEQVRQRALAAFNDKRCQPIRGLPPELYDVPGGWKTVTLGFKLPG